jgi:NDP-sugar pyrophosphorylase family protein
MRTIILCAGIGERLRPLTYNENKSLLKIGEKTLIEHWLDALIYSKAEIDTVHIIIGHYGYKFRKLLGSQYKNLKIQFVENKLFKITGAAQSLYAANNILKNNPCLILEGDHYMDPELMKKLIESEYENCLLVDEDMSRINFDEEVLAYGYGGLLQKLKWLPPYPDNPLGEALTIFKLSKLASNALASVLESYLLEDGPAKREIIEPFNRLIKSHDMQYVETNGKEWVEIDFISDIEKARDMKFG